MDGERVMTNQFIPPQFEVLLALSEPAQDPSWMDPVAAEMPPINFRWCRMPTGPDVVKRVERGGLSAALLVTDHAVGEGLSLLRIIRSIDRHLPCWFITPIASRQILEAALALRVTSVMTYPVEVTELTLGLRKALCFPAQGNVE